jgi:hypothetical protein
MAGVTDQSAIAHRYRLLAPHLTKQELHKWAAVEAASYGPGGITTLARITGIAAPAIRHAQRELQINKPTANTPSARAPAQPKNSAH